jgi:hypothetical protein
VCILAALFQAAAVTLCRGGAIVATSDMYLILVLFSTFGGIGLLSFGGIGF